MKISIITSESDSHFTLLKIVQGGFDKAFKEANEMENDGTLLKCKVSGFTVLEFENINQLNDYILRKIICVTNDKR